MSATTEVRRHRNRNPDKPDSFYYVELAVDPGEGPGDVFFRASLTTAQMPGDAEEDALADARQEHPNAKIDPFLTRKISGEKAEAIYQSMFERGDWDGWFSQPRWVRRIQGPA